MIPLDPDFPDPEIPDPEIPDPACGGLGLTPLAGGRREKERDPAGRTWAVDPLARGLDQARGRARDLSGPAGAEPGRTRRRASQ